MQKKSVRSMLASWLAVISLAGFLYINLFSSSVEPCSTKCASAIEQEAKKEASSNDEESEDLLPDVTLVRRVLEKVLQISNFIN